MRKLNQKILQDRQQDKTRGKIYLLKHSANIPSPTHQAIDASNANVKQSI